MNETLANDNSQVLPGDVLLLRSRGPRALLNRASQRFLRPGRPLQRAKFTHVALVVSSTHIADAMPHQGVRMRRWRDAAASYDLDKCVVVRHPALAADPEKQDEMLRRIRYYYNQTYRLSALASRKVEHGRGLVCSNFVALVMRDLDLPALAEMPLHGLPSDIDRNTRANGWRQFPFKDYGWRAGRSLVIRQPGHGTADMPSSEAGWMPDAEPATSSLAELASQLSDAVGERLAGSMEEFEAVCRALAELDRTLLDSAEALLTHPERLRGLDDVPEGVAQEWLSMPGMLEQWKALYLRPAAYNVHVLAEADAPQRLAQHRRQFGRSLVQISQAVKMSIGQVDDYRASAAQMMELTHVGLIPDLALVSSLRQLGEHICRSMVWLKDESQDTIMTRLDTYNECGEQLRALRPTLHAEDEQMAQEQLMALFDLERECLTWVMVQAPVAFGLMTMFASLESGLAERVGQVPAT